MKTIIKDNSRKLPSIVIAPILSPSLISDDEDRKSRLGSVDMEDDDPSRLVTKSVMKNQIDKIAEGNPTLVEGEYLKVFMNLFKSSFINKIPIAKDKAVQVFIYIYIYIITHRKLLYISKESKTIGQMMS